MIDDSQCMVMGCALNFDVEHVWIFVESLRRRFSGPVVLLVSGDRPRLWQYLAGKNVTPVAADSAHWSSAHLNVFRFVRYWELMRSVPRTIQRVLLSDVVDVYFQAHPFENLPAGELLFFLESDGKTIGQCEKNSLWIRRMFDEATINRLEDKPISCAGTTIGSGAAIMSYLSQMISVANPEKLRQIPNSYGCDQAIHNVLLHQNTAGKAIANGQHVLTLAGVSPGYATIDAGGLIRGPAGNVPAIVHQFNYHRDLLVHIAAKEGLQIQIQERGGERTA
jgi:hypothetical protein